MKRGFLREKAIFQISILIIAMVYFAYAIKPVSAEEVCCEKTISGDYCVYADDSNCDPTQQYAAVTCEQTSFCQLGCCFDLDEGQCYKSVSEASCLATEDAEFYSDEDCSSAASCDLGCCQIGTQCNLVTEQYCALQTAKYPELDMIYYEEIDREYECVDKCRAEDLGCCLNIDESCQYEARKSCEAGGGDFYEEEYCSDVIFCGCAEHHSKTCYDDDVYWVDSCGNTEEIAEDCDYASGTLCKELGGELTCGSVDCESTYDDEKNVHDSGIGGRRDNGESWCIYESPTGDGLDWPGSRHYRHMCVNGKEIIESCRDMREEICAQAENNGMTESQCLDNDIYDTALTSQVSTVPKGSMFWEGGEGVCEAGDTDCPVVWMKKNIASDWKCKGNCECEEAEHLKETAEICKSIGDCGADFNVMGKFTHDGFSLTSSGKKGPPSTLTDDQIKDWKEYGVYGEMTSLYQKILDYIEDILEQGGESEEDIEKALADTQTKGMYAALAGAAIAYAVVALELVTSTSLIVAGFCWPCLAVVAIILILTMTGDSKTYNVMTSCNPWVAPDGGDDCDKCLDQDKVDELDFYDSCTEYKCKSLGKNCEFISENAGTGRVACFDSNPNDVNSPQIVPWEEALTEGFSIETLEEGYEIVPEVPYYTKIEFGIKTPDELSQCKISTSHTASYDEMVSYFGDSYYQREHNTTVNPQAGGQIYDYYVRCKDGSGNANAAEYVIRFTTEDEPDFTAPVIEATNIDDYAYIASGLEEVALGIYVNEPANCRWSYSDGPYNDMENDFKCESTPGDALGYDAYFCASLLNVTEGENKYFFRCEDESENLNKNQQSYEYHLIGTGDLAIVAQSPEGLILDTISPQLYVMTSEGAEAGKATCYYTDDLTRGVELWPEFFETDGIEHTQQLQSLAQGEHNYYVRCEDKAMNEANTTITFTIDKDLIPPVVEYVYMDSV
ncbi:MAG: hypothetical protein L6408_08105, partial [Nanoarchaeota archaeon]|nr:hypothetical protein [Nanoarchaeota archaeon]